MRYLQCVCLVMALFVVLAVTGVAWANDLSRARGTVNNIRQADPPQVSTTTKPSPVGQPITDYKPRGPSPTISEVPPPQRDYNPQDDPDVQAGYDQHRADYYGS